MDPSEFANEGNEGIEPAEVASVAAAPARRRSWLKWIATAVVVVAVVAIASTYLYFANVYMPLTIVGVAPDTSSDSLFVQPTNATESWLGVGAIPFCMTPNGHFAVMFTLANDGDFPVTIQGGDPGPFGPVTNPDHYNSFALVDLASYRSHTGDSTSEPTDPRTAATLPPTTLEPGAFVDVWARYAMGSRPFGAAGYEFTESIWIRYSTFGVTRTAEVPLPGTTGVTSECGS